MEAERLLQDIVDARRRQYERLVGAGNAAAPSDRDEALIALRLAELELLRWQQDYPPKGGR